VERVSHKRVFFEEVFIIPFYYDNVFNFRKVLFNDNANYKFKKNVDQFLGLHLFWESYILFKEISCRLTIFLIKMYY